MSKMGAPTKYSKELADRICSLIATNPIGLNKIIETNNLPDRQTIYNWLDIHEDFFDNYMRAKELQQHVLVDKILEIPESIPVLHDKEGNERIDSGMLGRARLEFETIRWSAANLAPRFYSDSKNKEANSNDLNEDCKKRYAEMDKRNRKDY